MKRLLFTALMVLIAYPASLKAQGCEESSDADGLKVIGFIQPQYEYHFTEPTTNTFKFKRARLGVTGNIPYDFTYYVMAELSPFVSSTGNPYLLDAFISYRRYKWASVSMGSFKQPFGLEVNTACSGLYTIERALVSDQLVSPQRDLGLMLMGGDASTVLRYSFAIMNGTGLGVKDNNNKKDFVGRVTIKPLEWLRFGGSFRNGYPNTDDATRTSYAGEIELNYSNFLVQAEYITDEGDYNRAAGGGCGSEPMTLGENRDGYWFQAMYMTNFMLQPVVKYEAFDPDKNSDNDELSIITFGANYWFNDWTRLQVNYQYKAEKGNEQPNDALMVQVQVKF